jgi:hypothetical protein
VAYFPEDFRDIVAYFPEDFREIVAYFLEEGKGLRRKGVLARGLTIVRALPPFPMFMSFQVPDNQQ